MIKKEAITGYEDLEIDLYQDKRLEEKKDLWFESCLHDLDWETGFITIFGKTHQIPRLQAWYADNKIEYTYSCLLYTSPSPRDRQKSRMPSSA